MAGHSQFKNIMHRKGAQDASRSKLFSKLAREITVAAKLGLPDPAMNPRLGSRSRTHARRTCPRTTSSAPSRRRTGGDAENYEEIRYEGYGPGGVAVIVEALTDNRNRTAERVRSTFSKYGGIAGRDGSRRLHVRPRRRDRLPGVGRRSPRRCSRRRSRRAPTMSRADEQGHVITCAFEDLGDVAQALEERSARPRR